MTGRNFVVREAGGAGDVARVRRLVTAHGDARATTPGVEYVYADAAAMPGPYVPPLGGIWLASDGEKDPALFPSLDIFWKDWASDKRLAVCIRAGALPAFQERAKKPVLLARNRRSLVIANFDPAR